MKIACQEQLLPGNSLQEKWAFAADAGYDGIELRGKGELEMEKRLPELRQARVDGVPMPTVCVEMSHFIGAFDSSLRRDAIVQLRSQLSVIAELGGLGAMTPASYGMFSRRLPPFTPPRDEEGDHAVLLEALGALGSHARSEGVAIFVEPLNRYEDHMVNRLDQAVELVRAVGLDSVRVAADSYHMNIEEDLPADALRDAGPWIGHVQVSDSNRLQPGAGHLDWAAFLAAARDIRYDGYLAVECRLRGEPTIAVSSIPTFLRSVEASLESGP